MRFNRLSSTICLLFVFVSSIAASSNNSTDYVSIKIKSEEIAFYEKEVVTIPAIIKNISNDKVNLVINRWDKYYGFPIFLKNEKGEQINVRGKHPMIGGSFTVELSPNEEYKPVFKFIDLKTGVYQFHFNIAIGITRETIETSETYELKSDTITFSVEIKK